MIKMITRKFTKTEWSWIMQDWANSVYSLMITTAVFPIFYKSVTSNAGIMDSDSTAYIGYANSIATIVVALLAPFLGSAADYPNVRKPLFTVGTMLGIISVFSMVFVANEAWLNLLILYIISGIGFGVANIFYDSSLMDVTSTKRLDQVSSAGFGFGYIGSVIPFLIFMIFQFGEFFEARTTVNIGFILTAMWWLGFTIPYWRNVEQKTYAIKEGNLVQSTILSLNSTLREIKQYPHIALFLMGYFFYIDGVGTIIKMATSVGTDLGLTSVELILMLLVVQIVAFPCSILYGVLAKRFGSRPMLFFGIATYIVICVIGLGLETFNDFMVLAILVGSAQGGIQALSRSYFGSIIPKNKTNQFFGFYNIFGKFSSVMGTTLLAVVAQLTNDSLKGLFALIIQFIIGAILLFKAKPPKQATVKV